MSLLVRDNRVITPALRDGMPTTGAISGMVVSSVMSGFTEVIDVGTFTEGIVFLLTSGKAGTNPTLDVDLQYSHDGKNFVDSGDSFTQIAANGLFFKKFTANFGKYIRFRVKLGGTAGPSYTTTMGVALKA